VSASYSIHCNGCGTGFKWEHRFGPISLQAARRNLREDGWHQTREPDTSGRFTVARDICPSCWAEGVR